MDRFAFFVDAGYVYAAGGQLCHDTRNRAQLRLEFASFIADLRQAGEQATGCEMLRTYWYDAATEAIPTPSHQQIAQLPGVKLRLGTLNSNRQQKGVDTLLVRDLMRLSADHAIVTAFLLSGDEDLRQGVIEAQDCGVKVVLVGIEPTATNQSILLVREADDLLTLDEMMLRAHLSLREATPTAEPTQVLVPSGPAEPRSGSNGESLSGSPARAELYLSDPYAFGRQFAEQWLSSATPDERQRLLSFFNENKALALPREIDRELLAAARAQYGVYVQDDVRFKIRRGFRAAASEDRLQPP